VAREDIIPYQFQSGEEAQENGRKGGIASGTARRRKRSLKEAAYIFLSLPVTDTRVFNKLSRKGVDMADIDNQMAMICGLHAQASRGDAKAAKVLVDILGEQSRADPVEDQMQKARELLEGVDSVID
jgi:hypothetical protein